MRGMVETVVGTELDDLEAFKRALAKRLEHGPLLELIALQLRAATLPKLVASGAGDVPPTIELESLVQHAIDQLWGIIADLNRDSSSPVPLFIQLTMLCDQFRDGSGIDCRLLVAPAHVRFELPVDDIVFRAVRELLTNVRQHARATSVRVTSHERSDGVAITVSDDGVGLPPDGPRRNPAVDGVFGLWSIEQRLREIGAKLEIESGSGTRVTLVLPGRLLGRA
jgi:signal transduction histidine kinase